ncbi:CDP-glycerol glycerophosphotransferase family protein [Romboutsia maritimum]|nr:CDP-glycerol glycerophosphotransferase family protein [Romboutsia maritimum]
MNSFIDNQDCILIWRPHPLMEITIKTMRPKMLDWYESIIKRVNESKNIIVDQNSDVYPSIAISKALISDYSSVIFQYMITEKSILSMIKTEILDNSSFYAVDYLENYFLDKGVTVSEFIQMVWMMRYALLLRFLDN